MPLKNTTTGRKIIVALAPLQGELQNIADNLGIKQEETLGLFTEIEDLKEALLHLLGDECAMCGYGDCRALQFDHMAGGGHGDLKKRGRGQHSVLSSPSRGSKGKITSSLCQL